jgi:hypothetical protein
MKRSRLALLLFAVACRADAPAPTPSAPIAVPAARVHVTVSVDWEGHDLDPANLDAMRRFGTELAEVPLTHFLNAAYFTKPGADAGRTARDIAGVLRPNDECGLHIHCWRSLVEAAGVAFRTAPTFWGPQFELIPLGNDVGHEVELEAYTVDEIRALMRESRRILAEHGLATGPWFRAGGWIAGPKVREALVREGFQVDSSATDTVWFDELEGFRLPARVHELWPEVNRTSAPFAIATPAGRLVEMPDTGALADYTEAQEICDHLADAISRLQADPGTDIYVHTGFHQETAAKYVDRVIAALKWAQSQYGDRIVCEPLSVAAARFAVR